MYVFFSVLVTGTNPPSPPPPPPPHPTNNVGRVHTEFLLSTLYNVEVGVGRDCKVFSKN